MSNSDKVAAYLREHDDESLLIIVNLAEEPVENVKFFKKDEWNIAGRLTNSNDIKLDDQAKVIKFPSIPVGHFEVYSLTKPVK